MMIPPDLHLLVCLPWPSLRSMTSLYSDPQWSDNMDRAVSRLSGPGVELEEALAWLDERSKEEHFSLTDIWGVMTSAGIMKQVQGQRHKCFDFSTFLVTTFFETHHNTLCHKEVNALLKRNISSISWTYGVFQTRPAETPPTLTLYIVP